MKKYSRQQGYAYVLSIFLLAAAVLSIHSLYDVGQVTSHKMKVQNAADATAYSVASITARDMNFIATTNRIMVANQVAIGQMVGLSSYGHMVEQTAFNFDIVANFLTWIPIAGSVIKTITQVLAKAAKIMKQAFDGAAKAVIPVSDTIITVTSGLQQTFHFGMTGAAVEVYSKVIKDNDQDVKSSVVLGGYSLVKYIDEYRDTIERNQLPKPRDRSKKNKRYLNRFNEFHKVVNQSTDRFTRNRSNDWLAGLIHGRGGSEFKRAVVQNQYVWDWTAMDTQRFLIEIPAWPVDITIIDTALGWGAAHALNQNRNGDFYNYIRDRSRKRYAGVWRNGWGAWAAAADDGDNNLAKTTNLKPFYDLKSNGLVESGPGMVVLIGKPIAAARVWKEAVKNKSNYGIQKKFDVAEYGGAAKDQLITLAKAEPYFSRAPDLWARADRKIEFGNMYNPFWQVRLTKSEKSEHIAAFFAATGLKL